MRILHILDHSIPLHSGYTFRTRAILEQQRALGWETFHVTSPKHNGAKLSKELVDGFVFYRTPESPGLLARLPLVNQWSVIDMLERRLNEIVPVDRPDVLHAHSPALNGVAALRVGRRYGIPVVYEVRAFWEDAAVDHGTSSEWGLRYRVTRGLETYVLRHADSVTTICEGLRDEIIGRGIPSAKVTVIPNAVDPGQFSLGRARDAGLTARLGFSGVPVIGFIGSFYAYEGLPLLLRALPGICKRIPSVKVLLVGGGPQEEELLHLTSELKVADKVVFTGRVPHGQVQDYYNLVDVFVYPRLSMRLTDLVTPLKPLEAMAQGKMVVASDVGGHRELIRHGVNGLLFPAGAVDRLVDSVVYLLERREDWRGFQEAGRRFVESERSWAASVARYGRVYGDLVTREEVTDGR